MNILRDIKRDLLHKSKKENIPVAIALRDMIETDKRIDWIKRDILWEWSINRNID